MAKIQITENSLKGLIKESVLRVLNEETLQADQKYTLANVIRGAGWTGNVSNLIQQAGNTMATPAQWAQSIKNLSLKTKNRQLAGVYQQLSNQITQYTVDRNVAAAGAEKALANGGEMQNMGRSFAKPNPRNFTSIAQAVQDIAAANPNRTMSFQQEFTDSTGIFNGLDMNQVRNTINQKVRQAKTTLQQTNPQAGTVLDQVNNWVNRGGIPMTAKQLAGAFAALEKILKTSYNDTAVVAGFQRAMNLFGTRLGVDGVIGNQTRGALQQAGYKDIFAFKADAEAVQRALGVQPVDGKVGNNTMRAMQQNGITSLEAFKSVARRANGTNVASAVAAPQNQPMGPSQISQPAQPAGTLAESKLNKIVKESINKVLNEMENEGFWNDKVKPAAQKAGKAAKKAGKTVAKTVGKGVKAYGNAMKTNAPNANDQMQNYLNK